MSDVYSWLNIPVWKCNFRFLLLCTFLRLDVATSPLMRLDALYSSELQLGNFILSCLYNNTC